MYERTWATWNKNSELKLADHISKANINGFACISSHLPNNTIVHVEKFMRYRKEHELKEITNAEFRETDHLLQAYINGLTYISSLLLSNTIAHV